MIRPTIHIRFKESQAEYKSNAKLYQTTFFVDDSLTVGIKNCFFTAIKGDGISAGSPKATLQYADAASGVSAKGLVPDPSKRDMFLAGNDFNHENFLFPYGHREDVRIGLVKNGVMNVSVQGRPKQMYFFIKDETVVLGGTGVTTSDYGVHGYSMKEGTVVVKAGTKYTITAIDKDTGAITFDTTLTAVASDVVTIECELAKPLFLNVLELGADGKPLDHVAPFTLLENKTSGQVNQCVGEVANGRAAYINLYVDSAPAVNA